MCSYTVCTSTYKCTCTSTCTVDVQYNYVHIHVDVYKCKYTCGSTIITCKCTFKINIHVNKCTWTYYTQYMYMCIHILYIYTCISPTGLVTSPSQIAVEMLYIIAKSGGYFNKCKLSELFIISGTCNYLENNYNYYIQFTKLQ